jgi:transcriptional regulator with XRE-family HTH domain
MGFIAKNLSFLRKESKYTQAEIAAQLGIPKTTYASYEYGKAEPDNDMLVKISQLYSVELFVLISTQITKAHLFEKGKGAKNSQKSHLNASYPVTSPGSASILHEPSTPYGTATNKDEIIAAQRITIRALQSALEQAEARISTLQKTKK